MYNFDDANMHNCHHSTEGQYVAIKACTCLYMDETGHISTFLVTNLIVIYCNGEIRVEKGKGK